MIDPQVACRSRSTPTRVLRVAACEIPPARPWVCGVFAAGSGTRGVWCLRVRGGVG